MNLSSKIFTLFVRLSTLLLLATTACQEYEPPPEADLVRSGTGAYTVGEPLELHFSQPIVADSLQITLWPVARGTRRVPLEAVDPIAGPCSVDTTCDQIEISLSDDTRSAEFALSEPLAGPGATFILEVLPGLTDNEQNATGASYFFTVRFRANAGDPNANIQFDSGAFILGGAVNHPMRAVLTLVSHIQILPDGRFAMVGARGIVTDSEADDTTRDPEAIEVDDSEWGWTLFATGLVVENNDGHRFLETDAFQVEIPVLNGAIYLSMQDVRLFADITKDDDGNDFLDGTLTYEKLILTPSNGNPPTEYDGDSTELLGDFVPPELAPAGIPDMCEKICGAITGICDPPEGFPHEDFCTDDSDDE